MDHFVENKKVEEPLLIKIQANLPPSRGLGSSAAVAVAFIRASYDYLGLPLTDKELLENADWAERIAHGKPSGIDTKTIVTNQPVWYQKGEVEILKTLDLDGYMVLSIQVLKVLLNKQSKMCINCVIMIRIICKLLTYWFFSVFS